MMSKGDILCFKSSIHVIEAALSCIPESEYDAKRVHAELAAMLHVLDAYYSK